jgi:hypothetical protein
VQLHHPTADVVHRRTTAAMFVTTVVITGLDSELLSATFIDQPDPSPAGELTRQPQIAPVCDAATCGPADRTDGTHHRWDSVA